MGRTTNHLLVILALVLYLLFCCPVNVSAANNYISPISTKHDEDGRRELAGFPNVFAAGKNLFKNNLPAIKKLNDIYDVYDKASAVMDTRDFIMDITGIKKKFTEDNVIDYLNCQCDCPNLSGTGACDEEANYNNCSIQQNYCTSFQGNPDPLKCLDCSPIPPPPPPPPSVPSPSHASPLSHFVDTLLLMMISTTITIIIFIM